MSWWRRYREWRRTKLSPRGEQVARRAGLVAAMPIVLTGLVLVTATDWPPFVVGVVAPFIWVPAGLVFNLWLSRTYPEDPALP